jgi:hypothetical protein
MEVVEKNANEQVIQAPYSSFLLVNKTILQSSAHAAVILKKHLQIKTLN